MLVTLLPLHISWGVYPLALIAYPTNDSWRRNKSANFYLQTNITTVIVQVPEESGVCYHGRHPHSLLQCVFCSCFADLTFHCPFIYVCVWEGQRRGLYGPPGSCKIWLMAPRCSRCYSSFSWERRRQRRGLVLADRERMENWSVRNQRGRKPKEQ